MSNRFWPLDERLNQGMKALKEMAIDGFEYMGFFPFSIGVILVDEETRKYHHAMVMIRPTPETSFERNLIVRKLARTGIASMKIRGHSTEIVAAFMVGETWLALVDEESDPSIPPSNRPDRIESLVLMASLGMVGRETLP